MHKWIELLKRFFVASKTRKDLDSLLRMTPNPDNNLRVRIDWFLDIMQWIRSSGVVKTDLDFSSGIPQATRVKYALLVLEKNPEWKLNVAVVLRSIIKDTKALELFLNAGIPKHSGMWSEAFERVQVKLLPEARNDRDLVYVFTQTFKFDSDAAWIEQIDDETFFKLVELFNFNENENFKDLSDWNSLKKDARGALLLLSKELTALGLHSWVRQRVSTDDFRKSAFFILDDLTEKFLYSADPDEQILRAIDLKQNITKCLQSLSEVYSHMDEYGIGVSLVYHLEKTETLLRRMLTLIDLLTGVKSHSSQIKYFVSQLIHENVRSRSLRAIFNENLAMISRKIAETSAETGEHYIARSKKEFLHMMSSALGGGAVTALTTMVKFIIYKIPSAPFFSGLFSSFNFSFSFLAIQMFGMTLATKQPAMTAAALASKMKNSEQKEVVESLVDEIIFLIRSQLVAVVGNIMAVVPCSILIYIFFQHSFSFFLLSQKEALKTMDSFSFLGMTPFYAMFTGVLLFLSSLCAGWVHNWMIYRRLPTALAYNRTLVFTFGAERTRKFSLFVKRNTAGFAANISLGFLLGMTPFVAHFMGLPLDVRHVTLSSGALAFAAMTLGESVFSHEGFWWAMVGISSMAILNIGVSFGLALMVALRARKVESVQRQVIYAALWKRVKRRPFSLFYPTKE